MPQLLTTVKIYDQAVLAKLALAKPRILATNRAMTEAALEIAKAATMAATPIGPGHFGYHGRDTLKVEVTQTGMKTVGKLKGAIQLYWREYGTRGHFRPTARAKRRLAVGIMTGDIVAGSGERAFMTAHKALAGFKRVVKFYYGNVALWWGKP